MQVHRITYPDGKIYVGMVLTGTLLYFGSADTEYAASEFSSAKEKDFTIRKEGLRESKTATVGEFRQKEVEIIRESRSSNPRFGYNRWP